MTKAPSETLPPPPDPGDGTPELPDDPGLGSVRRFHSAARALTGGGLLLVALITLFATRDGWGFFLRSRTPEDLGQVEGAVRQGRLRHNTYVTFTARPLLESEGRSQSQDPAPGCLSGPARTMHYNLASETGDRVVLRTSRSLKATQQIPRRTRFTGRLLRLEALPETLKMYKRFLYQLTDCRRRPKACNRLLLIGSDLSRDALLGQIGKVEGVVRSADGHRIELRPLTPLFLHFRYPDEWEYRVEGASKEEAIARVKALRLPWIWVETRREDQLFVVKAPKAVAERLIREQRRGKGYGISQRTESFLIAFGQLARQGGSLVLRRVGVGFPAEYEVAPGAQGDETPSLKAVTWSGIVRVPLPRFVKASYHGPRHLPADAFLLLEGQAPPQAWPALLLAGVALAVALLGLALAILGLRRPRRP